MQYRRFWIFYYRVVSKSLKWKYGKNQIILGNRISKFNITIFWNRFEVGVNLGHLFLKCGLFGKYD